MAAHETPLSLGFSRQEHWSGLPFPSPMHESEKWKWSLSVVSDSSRPRGRQPTRLLHPWDFPGKSAGVGCHCLLQGARDQIANICWIIEKARQFQKNIYFCFIDFAKAFDCVNHNKLWKILKDMGIPDHLTCLLRNLYAGQDATVRTGCGTIDWFQIGKGSMSRLYVVTQLI